MSISKKNEHFLNKHSAEIQKIPLFKKIPIQLIIACIAHAHYRRLKAGEILFNKGDIDGNVYLILSGLMKAYYTENEKRNVSLFYKKYDLVTTVPTFFEMGKAWVTIEAVTSTIVVYIKRDFYLNLLLKYDAIFSLHIDTAREILIRHKGKLGQLMFSTAKERYSDFVKNFGPQLPYLPQKDIASYLHITQETLSRLRKDNSKGVYKNDTENI